MKTNIYIFVSVEGETLQPLINECDEYQSRDIDNLQVIGISKGIDAEEAYTNLINESAFLKETSFNELIAWKLSDDYLEEQKYFYLKP